MPCTVKCRCGKAEMRFEKLKPGQIEAFECPACNSDPKAKIREERKEAPKVQSNPYGRRLKPTGKMDKAPSAAEIAEVESEKESE